MGEVVYGPAHIKTPTGCLKILEIICCLVAIILLAIGISGSNDLISAYYAATIIGLIVSFLILVVTWSGRSLHDVLKYQYFIHLILFIFLIVTSSILFNRHYNQKSRVSSIFGMIAAVFYLTDAIMSYRSYYV